MDFELNNRFLTILFQNITERWMKCLWERFKWIRVTKILLGEVLLKLKDISGKIIENFWIHVPVNFLLVIQKEFCFSSPINAIKFSNYF